MNFSNKFTSIVSSLLATQKAHIVDSGFISEAFRVERGVRQGDPLSPLLYVIAINPLIQAIDQNIKGIPVNGSSFRVAAYADDLSIGIGQVSDWNKLQETLLLYEQASNAQVNKSKSTLIPLTANANRVELTDQSRFNLQTNSQNNITILGFTVDYKGQADRNLWSNTIKKIKNKIQDLSQRNLSFKGKILATKMLLISKIWYSAYLLPPTRKQLNEIDSLIKGWIKSNSRMLPQYSIFQLSYEQGGLSAPVLKDMLDARLLTILIKLLTSNTFWATTERETINAKLYNKRKISAAIALSQTPCKTKGWPDSWKPYITAWGRFKGKILTNHTWPWLPEQIKINNIDGNLFTVKGALKSFHTPSSSTTTNSSEKHHSPFKWLKTKGLLNKKKDIFWRLTHRALPLGYRLIHIDQTNLGDCPNCPYITQTIEHFALKCPLSKVIWETIYKALTNIEQDTTPRTLEDIIQATNITDTKKRKTAIWLHITAIYEIWCWYTQARWGDNVIPQEAIARIISIKIKHEINLLYKLFNKKALSKSGKTNNILKYINLN
ncbi:1145_t:CDS:1, partial [Ambispora leptoticha]